MGHLPPGYETYGINVMQVQEVLRYTEIARSRVRDELVLGIINLRGNVVTVIGHRQRFGLLPTRSPTTPVSSSSRRQAGRWHPGRQRGRGGYLRQSEIETAPNVGNDESAKFSRVCATRTASC